MAVDTGEEAYRSARAASTGSFNVEDEGRIRRMSKLYVLAGGIVEGRPGRVSAFVAYNPKPGVSRLFKVQGSAAKPEVSELPAATTVDLGRFRKTLQEELEPALAEITALGGTASIVSPRADWISEVVGRHLKSTEGIDL